MRRIFVVALAATALGGCSGFQGTMSSLSRGGGQSMDAKAQNDCQDKYGPLGPAAVMDCTRELSQQRKDAATAGAPAQR